MTKNDSISIRICGVYTELTLAMECFQNIMKLMNEIEEINADYKKKQPFIDFASKLLKDMEETIMEEKSAVDEGGKD